MSAKEMGMWHRLSRGTVWVIISLMGAGSLGAIALYRQEPINAMWLIVASVCTYLIGYRFYSRFIALRVVELDDRRATPAERIDDGRDFVPTNKWVLLGHHFAAIAGPGPLVGPTLAAQLGYLPGTLWIVIGAVLGGCVQDFVILFASMRRNGKSLGQIAKEEVGPLAGFTALFAIISILTILLAVIALVVTNALKSSPWGTFTLAMTIPIAMLMGIYMRFVRPGKVLETSLLGFRAGHGCRDRRPIYRRHSRAGVAVHLRRAPPGAAHHRLWICCFRAPGMAAAGAARLFEHLRQTGHDLPAGAGDSGGSADAGDARADALHRRDGSGLRR